MNDQNEGTLEQVATQKRPERTLVIYHANCADGFTAAWVVRKALGEENCEFFPANYDDEVVPDYKGRNVVIVDFSYKRDDMLKLIGDAESVVILDHHKTAEADLEGIFEFSNVEGKFDMKRSGAMLAWLHYFPDEEPPLLIKTVQDRDLYQFKYEGTHAFTALFKTFYYEFITWDFLAHHLEHPKTAFALFEQGEAVERFEQKQINQLSGINKRDLLIGGHIVPACNVPHSMASDVGNILAKGQAFAACYSDTEKGRTFQLRSDKDNEESVDVSKIAEAYGGGGHKNAAGFTVPHNRVGQFELVNNTVDEVAGD